MSRAYNLYTQVDVDLETFIDILYQARAITKERSATISKKRTRSQSGLSLTNKMPFYFAVVEDLLVLRAETSYGTSDD